MTSENIEQKLEDLSRSISDENSFTEKVMSRIDAAPNRTEQFKKAAARRIIFNRFWKLAAAACLIFAVTFGLYFGLNKSVSTAYAAEQVLSDAAKAIRNFKSIYIKINARTLPHDNFAIIDLNHDFVLIELWKKVDESGHVKWKVEKPGRLLVMDGNSITMLIKPNLINKLNHASPNIRAFDSEWFGRLAEVKDLIEYEYKNVQRTKDSDFFIGHEKVDGREKLLLEVNYAAQGDYKNDYLKNKFVWESNHTKVYQFDADTKLLEKFKIIVHTDQNDVTVLETSEIQYDPEINDKVFALELPQDLIYVKEPEILPDNEKYARMSPKEAAEAFFKACADENWDEFLKFWYTSKVDDGMKKYLGGIKIISIGEPFKSGLYPGWFVPYEIQLKSGYVKKWNLGLKKNPKANRYIVDGGI